eukprot:5723486-Prymnesium_polylepis.1
MRRCRATIRLDPLLMCKERPAGVGGGDGAVWSEEAKRCEMEALFEQSSASRARGWCAIGQHALNAVSKQLNVSWLLRSCLCS